MPAKLTAIRSITHISALIPLAYLIWLSAAGRLGSDPAQHLVHELGFWGLVMLWASLAMTPLRLMTSKPWWIAIRRALGLWSFAYICLHLVVFVTAWCGLDRVVLREELLKRPYILIGLTAWVFMIPLAVTSTQAWRRKLGRRWNRLHRMVYAIAALALIHLSLFAKLEYVKPLVFGILLIFLFFIRWRARQASSASIKCAPSA